MFKIIAKINVIVLLNLLSNLITKTINHDKLILKLPVTSIKVIGALWNEHKRDRKKNLEIKLFFLEVNTS